MKFGSMIRRIRCAVALCALLGMQAGFAQETPAPAENYQWEFMFSPYTVHYSNDSEHKPVYLLGIERNLPGNWNTGFGYFSNSFGQPSVYVFYGYEWDKLFNVEKLYAKLAVGMMYGYVEPYEDKVPFNHDGFSPLVLPVLGYRLTQRDALQVIMLGSAGLMFSYSRRF